MPKKATTTAASPKKKKEVKSPAKSLRDHSLASNLPVRLKPSTAHRESKAPTRLTITVEEKKVKPIVIPKGKGKKLGDCPNVVTQINKRTKSDDLLKTIHGLVLGRVVKGVDVKGNLLNFKGLDISKEASIAKIDRLRLKPIRDMLAFFGQDPKGEREEIVKRLADFLDKPAPSDEKYSTSPKKRARSSSPARSKSPKAKKAKTDEKKKKAKKDPNAPKRPKNAYMFFGQEVRDKIRSKNPNLGVTEVAKKIGEKWKKLSDKEKKKYEEQAAKDKARYEKEKAKYEKKGKK